MRRLLVGLIQGYRYVISPWLSPACRFDPTCSQYAMDAQRKLVDRAKDSLLAGGQADSYHDVAV